MTKNWIALPRSEGRTSRQAHVNLPAGTYERELGRDGFFGPASQMYHRNPPTAWIDWQGPLRPRAFDLARLATPVACPWEAVEVLRNAHCRYRFWRTQGAMDHLARNGDGDDLLFVHGGEGDLFCDYGHLAFRTGDYIVVPRGTMWRVACRGAAAFLMIETTNGAYRLPEKGMLGRHAVFDPAMLDTPAIDDAFLAQQGAGPWQVRIRRRGAISTVTYPFNPLDAVGWHGDLSVVRLNVADIRPLTSHRYHLPPSAHTTFVADRFVVCTFAPRPIETDPEALKVPFFHNNDDYDEVIFYHAGDFFSRDNIHPGMVTFHPAGFTHGPHPKALDGMLTAKRQTTDEYAVMLDTRDGLDVADLPAGVEQTGYVDSWQGSLAKAPDAR
ncbi:MAG: homogentisate 1,2-dioxygenase [Alphaproteobacteria bacterium]|nr:homogentisate 1,2-dioxygenase [Alphaproteobacteria bacterium]